MIEPPKVDAAIKDGGPKLPPGLMPAAAPPPQIQTEEPKLAFETPGSYASGHGVPKEAPPSTSVADAMRALSHSGGGGVVVGDLGVGDGGLGPGIKQAPSAGGRRASSSF